MQTSKSFQVPFVMQHENNLKLLVSNTSSSFSDDPELHTLKSHVDAYKNQIGTIPQRFKWRQAVKYTNPYENVGNCWGLVKISRAYWKLLEVTTDFGLLFDNVKELNALLLCEGPGGFVEMVQELRAYQNKGLNWTGITLKNTNNDPNLPDFVPVLYSDKERGTIVYGEDGTGDLTHVCNIKSLPRNQQLVTADGGFDVSNDYDSQETQSFHLLFAQSISALYTQSLGGSFVMKMFETDTQAMVDLIYLMAMHYNSVYITKPNTSRPCNSERYLVCKEFRGIDDDKMNTLFHMLNEYNQTTGVVIDRLFTGDASELFKDVMVESNKKYYTRQKEALGAALAYAKRTHWVEKPRDMSCNFMKMYYGC